MKILRLPEVKAKTGLSHSAIYTKINEGDFPKPISLGPRTVGWIDSDLDNWIESLRDRGWTKSTPGKKSPPNTQKEDK